MAHAMYRQFQPELFWCRLGLNPRRMQWLLSQVLPEQFRFLTAAHRGLSFSSLILGDKSPVLDEDVMCYLPDPLRFARHRIAVDTF